MFFHGHKIWVQIFVMNRDSSVQCISTWNWANDVNRFVRDIHHKQIQIVHRGNKYLELH